MKPSLRTSVSKNYNCLPYFNQLYIFIMKKFLFSFVLLSALVLMLPSCHKHDEEDANPPVVTVTSPSESASISGAVTIAGNVTDESLHALSLEVTKDSDGSSLYAKSISVHDKTEYGFNETWTPSGIGAETAVTLTVVVEDHSDLKTTKTVKFTVKP